MPNWLITLLQFFPPWLLIALLVGVANAAACFLLVGRGFIRLGWYVLVGALSGGVGQVLGQAYHWPSPVQVGDVNVAAVSLATWCVLLLSRIAGL